MTDVNLELVFFAINIIKKQRLKITQYGEKFYYLTCWDDKIWNLEGYFFEK